MYGGVGVSGVVDLIGYYSKLPQGTEQVRAARLQARCCCGGAVRASSSSSACASAWQCNQMRTARMDA
jgi:hypothetical protein